jgi:outer membrane protein OmpA-like peptidoglycan-associated protein
MGMKGDAPKGRLLSEARAQEVRDYLVQNFMFDDTKVMTMGLGKTAQDSEEGL